MPRPVVASTGFPRITSCDANVVAQLKHCERLIALEDRLPAVLQGKDKPADASETLEFAELCGILGQASPRHACTPRPWRVTATGRGPPAVHRYRAACAAALAGRGRGEDGPAQRSGAGPGASGHARGFGRRSLSGRGRWTAVRTQIVSWLPRS